MTKADLIEEVSRLAELTRKDSEVIVETIFDSIVRSLRVGDKIEIRGFGSFRTRQRKPRVGRNPKTGDRVEVPAKKIPFFKPSKELKDLVNTSGQASTSPAPGGAATSVALLADECEQPSPSGTLVLSSRVYLWETGLLTECCARTAFYSRPYTSTSRGSDCHGLVCHAPPHG